MTVKITMNNNYQLNTRTGILGTENNLVTGLLDAKACVGHKNDEGKNCLEVAEDRLKDEDLPENQVSLLTQVGVIL